MKKQTIEIIEEHSSWWTDSCNTMMLLNNDNMMYENSKGNIRSEIEDLEDDIKFLKKIMAIKYKKSWEIYYNQLEVGKVKRPLLPKPDNSSEPREITALKELIIKASEMANMMEEMKEEFTEEDKKKALNKLSDVLKPIDDSMREVDYKYNGKDYFDIYGGQVEKLKKQIKRIKSIQIGE